MNKGATIMKKLKTFIAIAMCFLLTFGCVACSGGDSGDITVINVVVGQNAYGTDLLEEQAKRFEELYATKSYADGKQGVDVKIQTSGTALNIDESLLSEGYHIIATGDGYTKAATAASNGWITNINDIMTTKIGDEGKSIADKIPDSIAWNFYLDVDDSTSDIKSGYYGIPSVEAYGGLSFDKDLFDNNGFYFASEETENKWDSQILGSGYTYYFTDDATLKSVGSDGVSGTEDDGLPSSLYELIALCEYLENNSIVPFGLAGDPNFYINYFVEALYVSLLGYEDATALKSFNTDSVDIVVGYSDEDIFPGLEGVKKPITQSVKIEERYGYYMSSTVEKYYTTAFMKLVEQEGWYHSGAEVASNSATLAQSNFICGLHDAAKQTAMLIECSYWYNESRIDGNFIDYDKLYAKIDPDRELRWMCLPVNISTSVSGVDNTVNTGINVESTKGEPTTLYIPDGGYLCVNAKFKDNTEIMGAIKDYLLFRFSDAELSKYSAKAAYRSMLEYDIKDSDLADSSTYIKSWAKIVKSAKMVYPYGDSDVYRNNSAKLGKQGGSASYLFGGGALGTTNAKDYIKTKGVLTCFEEKMLDIVAWNGYFGTSDAVPEAQKYPAGHPKAGQDIKYEGTNYSA